MHLSKNLDLKSNILAKRLVGQLFSLCIFNRYFQSLNLPLNFRIIKERKKKSNILHVILLVKVLLVDLAQHKIKRNEFDHLIQTLNKYVC